MCGICGVVDLGDARAGKADLVASMAGFLRHRGPDEGGIHESGRVAIGMRRLSIIDLAGGHQPIPNEDRTVWVVANCEIYNFIELRADLERKGHRFSTSSDTEVIVHLYEEMGDDFPSALNGMFAIAILDMRRDRLLLARDRLGKKPLFYAEADGRLGFASDIKPLFLLPGLRREVDVVALNALLRHNYVPRPATLFAGIREVEAGGVLVVEDGRATTGRFWDLRERVAPAPAPLTASEARAKTRALFEDAVRLRMRSDVPVGLFLSGGIDSTLVGAAMRGAEPEARLLSFSVGFDHPDYDESREAAEVAEVIRSEHHAVRIPSDSILPRYRDIMWYIEEPHGDTSFVPTFAVSGCASEHVRVVLTGDGGDEVFAGYTRYLDAYERAKKAPATEVFRQTVEGYRVADDATRRDLLAPGAYRDLPEAAPPAFLRDGAGPGEVVRALLLHDTLTLLTDNNVVKPDKMGMACSLEARCPFLDYRLVEFGLNVPGDLHVEGGRTKAILRDLAAAVVPEALANRPKQQFTVPFGEWMRQDPSGEVRRLLSRLAERPWFEAGAIRKLYDEHRGGERNHTRILRLLVAIEIWCETFLDVDPLAGGPRTTRTPPKTLSP